MDEFNKETTGSETLRSSFRRGLTAGLCIGLIIMLAVAGVLFIMYRNASFNSISGVKANLIKMVIKKYYYQDVTDETLEEGAYRGMVESTGDPFSTYFTPEEYKKLQEDLAGGYAGIGAALVKDPDTGLVTIKSIYADSPSEKAGLKEGDIILGSGSFVAADMELADFVKELRGDPGTEIELVMKRGDEQFTVKMTRAIIVTPSVDHRMLDDKIGYMNISEFDGETENEFDEAMKDLEKQGMKAIVFDLRTNPGGLVDSVTDILDKILPEGVTVYMIDKDGKKEEFKSDAKHHIDIPITVLTSSSTASSAEIFSGAIRDFKYGTIIGEKTYGKGIVQRTIPLADGSAVKLTVETYYTPSGASIHGEGITPDIELEYEYSGDTEAEEYDYLADNQILKAMEVLEEELNK